jgi:hypothetical protein
MQERSTGHHHAFAALGDGWRIIYALLFDFLRINQRFLQPFKTKLSFGLIFLAFVGRNIF